MNWDRISEGLVVRIVLNAAFAAAAIATRYITETVSRRNPRLSTVPLAIAAAVWAILNSYSILHWPPWHALLGLLISSAALGWLAFRHISQFRLIGLFGVDRTVASGLGYKAALGLCRDQLDFLGVGASKLTTLRTEFEGAMARCNRANRPIRFLLCHPLSASLERFAQQAGRDRAEYQRRVRESLKVIADQHRHRSRNVEVRFYREGAMPLFRLMFINNAICLASHYVFGEGDGSQLPQLRIGRVLGDRRSNESLYHPLEQYFERLWEDAEPWDFEESSLTRP